MIAILVIPHFVAAWNIAQCSCSAPPIPWRHKLRAARVCQRRTARPSGAAARSTRPRRRAICAAADGWGAESLALGALVGQRRRVSTATIKSRYVGRLRQKLARSVLLRAWPPPAQLPRPMDLAGPARNPVRSPQCGRKLTPAEVQDAGHLGATKPSAKRGLVRARNGPLYQLYIIRKIGPCACVCTTGTSSTTPASGAALQWWSTSALA